MRARASRIASRVAAIPEVRAALTEFQRAFARTEPGAVLDGRDIGTVICPGAEVKIYVTASDSVRAHRRAMELGADEAMILAELRERDARDAARDVAPMRPADDAEALDTTALRIEDAIARAIAIAERARTQARP